MNAVPLLILSIGVFGTTKLIFKTLFGPVWILTLLSLWVGTPVSPLLGFPPEGLSFIEFFGYAVLNLLMMIVVFGIVGKAYPPLSDWADK